MLAAAVLYVKDPAAMSAFYAACFEMTVLQEDQEFCILTAGDRELSFVRLPDSVADSIEISQPPRRRAEVPAKLVFDVGDLEDAVPRLIAAGGHLDPNDEAWELNGYRRQDCLDPEGNVLQLRAPRR